MMDPTANRPDCADEGSDLLRQAFEATRRTALGRRPDLGLLAPESNLWRRVHEKLREGYERGICDIGGLSDYAQSVLMPSRDRVRGK